jgi:hypothetical protein
MAHEFMHQTFYIDLEEEISSVIDRLNKSMATDNFFVIPKRAIFLQSIVNLKLLKREADKVRKTITIVTQDEIGTSMAERCGIEVRQTLEGLEEAAKVIPKEFLPQVKAIEPSAPLPDQEDAEIRTVHQKELRLSGVGSSDFYDLTNSYDKNSFDLTGQLDQISLEPVIVAPTKVFNSKDTLPIVEIPRPVVKKSIQADIKKVEKPKEVEKPLYQKGLDLEKEKTLEKMYAIKKEKQSEVVEKVGNDGKLKKIFVGFILLCLLLFVAVAGYLIIPSAKIIIEQNIAKSKINLDLKGNSEITDSGELQFPVRAINGEETIALSYDVKGSASSQGKKAQGSVTIYNEYDKAPQTLVATTRLESPDGKIFHIQKNVVVPGVVTINGETKPGAASVDVVADQAGLDYNLESTTFTIPGFKDSPKYTKFYAKSAVSFTGGTDNGENIGGSVTQGDIDKAKQKTETLVKEKMVQAINDQLQSGEVAVEQAQKISIVKSSANAKIGQKVDTFQYSVSASYEAIIFSENEIKKIVINAIESQQDLKDMKKEVSKLEYGTVNADFDKKTLELKVYAEIIGTPLIDKEQVKKDLLGKNSDQFTAILKKYNTIKSVNIEFQPKFVSRIPQYSQRVTIEVREIAN